MTDMRDDASKNLRDAADAMRKFTLGVDRIKLTLITDEPKPDVLAIKASMLAPEGRELRFGPAALNSILKVNGVYARLIDIEDLPDGDQLLTLIRVPKEEGWL